MDLATHRILITGGTRGIGYELARVLLDRGGTVAVCGRREERLAEIRDELPAITTLRCDVGDVDSLPGFVDRLRAEFGAPTVLVNNAGIQYNHSWTDTPPAEVVERLRSEIAVNLTGPLALAALLLDDLVRGPESVLVNVSSSLVFHPKRSAPVYCATKAAIHSFTQAIRYQLAAHPNLRVVEAYPPLVDTGMTEGRGSGKISAAQAAREIADGLAADSAEIFVGKAKQLRVLNRLAPGLVARLLRDG